MIGRPCSVCLFISQPSSPRVTSLHGKEFVDKDLAVVMNHLAAYATVVVLVTSDHAPASVPMLFGEHDFLVSVLVALAVHGLTARGLLVEVIDPPFVHDVVVPKRLEKTPRETQPVSPLLEDPETRSAAFPAAWNASDTADSDATMPSGTHSRSGSEANQRRSGQRGSEPPRAS